MANTSESTEAGVPVPPEIPAAPARRWWALAVLGVAQLMVALDVTVMNVALPAAQRELAFADVDRQWVMTGYALTFGSLLLLGGRLGDLLGRRRALVVGLLGFGIASAVGGLAPNFVTLVAARIGQGLFGALLAPAALALVAATFTDPAERARAYGLFSAISAVGGAIGLLLGGALTEWASWRWALYINLAFAVVGILGALLTLPRETPTRRPRLDIPGVLLISAGLFGVVGGFSRATDHGWGDPVTLGLLCAGVVLVAAFAAWQSRATDPLLPPRVVLDPARAGSYLAVALIAVGMFAVFLFFIYYLQTILGYSPLKAGVAFMPMVTTTIVSAAAAVPLLQRIGAKVTVSLGFAISAAGMVWLTGASPTSTYTAHLLPGLTVLGLGIGAVMSVAFQGATAGIDNRDAGAASALVNAVMQVGGSLGIAVLTTIATDATRTYATSHAPSPTLLTQAQVHGYTTTFWCAAWIFLIGGLLVTLLIPAFLPKPPPGTPIIAH
ncbi:MFS transporter [Nocardia sp. NPDC004722]